MPRVNKHAPVRRDECEIGIEREYALYAQSGGQTACLLAVDRLLALLQTLIAADERAVAQWQQMQADGWRLEPEYSHCLVEAVSPPFTRQTWPELLAGFGVIEAWLDQAAERLEAQSRFDRVMCTAQYSVRTDAFVSWQGDRITTFSELLLDPDNHNYLIGPPDDVPPCFAGGLPHLAYASFTSANATVHAPMPGPANGELADHAEALADYFWHVLRIARRIELSNPHSHDLLIDGHIPRSPHPDVSVRDALIRWADPDTAHLLDAVEQTMEPSEGLQRFIQMFGQPPSSAFKTDGFMAYSCRPRVVENTMLFELRCFHPGLPLTTLGELLGPPDSR